MCASVSLAYGNGLLRVGAGHQGERQSREGSGDGLRPPGVLRAAEIAQSSISCQTACSSCSSHAAPGSAMAQLVQVPAGRAGAVRTLARTAMPGVSSTGERSGAVVIPQCVGATMAR